jgi:hypothetical protein
LIIQGHLIHGSIRAGSSGFEARLVTLRLRELGQLLQLEGAVQVEGVRVVRVEVDDDLLGFVGIEPRGGFVVT